MANTTTLTLQSPEAGLRFGVECGSGTRMTTDSGPGMVAPNPAELLLVALGGCQAMDVISILRKKRLEVTGYEVVVTGERRTEHPKSYTAIEVLHRVRGRGVPAAAVTEAARLSATKYCTVHASLSSDIAITTRYEVFDEEGAVPREAGLVLEGRGGHESPAGAGA